MRLALACAILLIVGIFSIELFLVPYVDVPKGKECVMTFEYVPIACVSDGILVKRFYYNSCGDS